MEEDHSIESIIDVVTEENKETRRQSFYRAETSEHPNAIGINVEEENELDVTEYGSETDTSDISLDETSEEISESESGEESGEVCSD